MFSVRPAESPHHLLRPRLLEVMPDEPGFVVWLEAPYGYGKSILASQWAWGLEDRGWRVVWLSLAEREARSAIAQRLDLPATAPWGVLLDELWRMPTVLVLEELDGSENLQPLLKHVGGLLLLASRQHLPYPPLAQLATTDRLTHVTADMLAFNAEEATQLFVDQERAAQALRDTKGWPLPLHFASLADSFPTDATLLEGVRNSVSEDGWRELLFTAALDQLPRSAAVAATYELVKAGFLQELADAYRLHPLVAEGAMQRFRSEVHAELDAGAERLTPLQRGAAYERTGHLTALADLITSSNHNLQNLQPSDYLRWNGLVPDHDSPYRRAYVCEALLLLNRYDEALPDVDALLADERLTKNQRVLLTAMTVYALGIAKRYEQCAPYMERLEAQLPVEDPVVMGRALMPLIQVAYLQGEHARAESLLGELIQGYAKLEPGPLRSLLEAKARNSMYMIAWEVHGTVEEHLALQLATLEKGELDQHTNLSTRQNAAVNLAFMWEVERAAAMLRDALKYAAPFNRLMVEAMLAFLELDVDKFPALLTAAKRWEQFELSERVSALWLRSLRFSGDLTTAESIAGSLQMGPYTKLELLWVAEAEGRREDAERLLEETRGAYPYREYLLHWHAANYLLSRTDDALDQLLALVQFSYGQGRITRFVGLQLEHLPKDRPELALNYPLHDVLVSGWAEAIAERLSEIPPLEVTLHGEFSAQLMGRELVLSDRQQQLLALLVTGRNREFIGEAMWPEVDSAKQRNNLGVQLNVLRKTLEPWGVTTFVHKDGLRNFVSDHVNLLRALNDADAATVLATYREPLFAGLDLEELSDAGYQIRERVVALLLEAGTSGTDHTSVEYLKRVLELEPLHEEAVQALLARLVAKGRGREARQVYGRFAERLAQETGLTPQPTTTELVAAH
ncbi:MAG: BTAD domain-containing putative transcriptional regulator [Trueperaceae bacterium]